MLKENAYVDRITELFNNTVNDGIDLACDILDIDYYSSVCRYMANNKNEFKMYSHTVCSFKYHDGDESYIVMIFYIPSKNNYDGNGKHITTRVIDIIKVLEEAFVTIDIWMDDKKEDHYSYLIAKKKYK